MPKIRKDVFTNSRKILSDYAFLRQQIKINQEVIKMNKWKKADNQKLDFKLCWFNPVSTK